MTPRLRKFALTAHVTLSVGWLGAMAGFLALAVATLTSADGQMVRASYLAMELTTWCVIVPFAFAALLSGLFQSLGTEWGFIPALLGTGEIRYYGACNDPLAAAHAPDRPPRSFVSVIASHGGVPFYCRLVNSSQGSMFI